MPDTMKRVASAKRGITHIEAPGCIVNIHAGLTANGKAVTTVSVSADGNRYAGDAQWWIEGEAGRDGLSARIVQTDTPAPIVLHTPAEVWHQVRDLIASVRSIVAHNAVGHIMSHAMQTGTAATCDALTSYLERAENGAAEA